MVAPRALCVDVFGTCVDWRGSIIAEGPTWDGRIGACVDWASLADAWRARYQPSMEAVRREERAFVNLDVLHRESLDELAPQFGLDGLSGDDRDELTRIWHRLDPWPDVVSGLKRLRGRVRLSTLSNGGDALLNALAERGGLPFDHIIGAESFGAYKPLPMVYLGAAKRLGLRPDEVMMVAAHNDDLRAAAALGLMTAFVARPTEYGPAQIRDREPEGPWDFCVDTFIALADAVDAIPVREGEGEYLTPPNPCLRPWA